MAYIRVDVDLGEFESYDLISELLCRIEHNRIKQNQLSLLKDVLNLNEEIEIKTLDDFIKMQHLTKVFSMYTTTEIENLGNYILIYTK